MQHSADQSARQRKSHPRHAVTLLAAALLIPPALIAAILSFDLGSVMMVRSQLQVAADSAAVAAARVVGRSRGEIEAAARQQALCPEPDGSTRAVKLASEDIEFGIWDDTQRMFTPTDLPNNAIRITARAEKGKATAVPLVLPQVLGKAPFTGKASAVAEVEPREICFVADLSGSSNDDTEPGWAADAINAACADRGCPPIAARFMQQVYDDFGFGPFPGPLQGVAAPWNLNAGADPCVELTRDGGPLTSDETPARYRISKSDDAEVRKVKCYSAIIDLQIAALMPRAKPVPSSTANYAYWAKYLDYVLAMPSNVGPTRIDRMNNPDCRRWPSTAVKLSDKSQGYVGYATYVQFMMDHGRDGQPVPGQYTPLSCYSPECPWHTENTAAGMLRFPPREQPVHGVRLALIAAIERLKRQNAGMLDTAQRDWVSIVAFDNLVGGGPRIIQPLTGDYDAAILACTSLQAGADSTDANAADAGLATAHKHIRSTGDGGKGRASSQKIVILLTDGAPQLFVSEPAAIDEHAASQPETVEFPRQGEAARDAVLMRIHNLRTWKYQVFTLGIGVGRDEAFLDAMARVAGTADAQGRALTGGGDPSDCGQPLLGVIEKIIDSPQVRLVY